LSAMSSAEALSACASPPAFISTKRAAFHSLLAKLRAASALAQEKRMSLPGDVPFISENRSASAPYFSMTSSGSMPLPSDLDIFLPSSSRTMPCISTSPNGFSRICAYPNTIMRATQKKMMSYPVTSTLVG